MGDEKKALLAAGVIGGAAIIGLLLTKTAEPPTNPDTILSKSLTVSWGANDPETMTSQHLTVAWMDVNADPVELASGYLTVGWESQPSNTDPETLTSGYLTVSWESGGGGGGSTDPATIIVTI